MSVNKDDSVTERDVLLTIEERQGDNYNDEEVSDTNHLMASLSVSETCLKTPLNEYDDNTYEKEGGRFLDIGNDLRGRHMPKLPPGKAYHLFISFANEDAGEDANKICKELENRFGFRCMQFERDFVPGKSLDENIASEMAKSVKVLILITSKFLKSRWCMTEVDEATRLSYCDGEKLKIIPVLLRPLEDGELPQTLKKYRYIDAQKEVDLPAKIFEAYYHSDAVDGLKIQGEQELTEEQIKNQNGARLLSKMFTQQQSYMLTGYVFETERLTLNEQAYLTNIHAKCVDQLESAITLVTKDRLMRMYKIFGVTKITHVAALMSAILFVLLPITLQITSILITAETSSTDTTIALSVFCGLGCYFIVIMGVILYRRKLTNHVRRKLWQCVNKDFYRETMCLVVYNGSQQPSLTLMRYNTAPCQEYLKVLIERKYFYLDEERIKKMAEEMIDKKFLELQLLGHLSNWSQLPTYDYNRHRTWLKKQCLCQMLEYDLINIVTTV